MVVETQAANVMGGKTARACDACMRRRARWYCAADDAFLCQSCDSSIHSANQLARRHERVRLRTCSTSPPFSLSSSSVQSPTDKTTGEAIGTPVWYQGFTRKARTPRSLLGKSIQRKKVFNVVEDDLYLDSNSNDPLVPELGSEDGSFSFSSVDENEENLSCRVPVFDFPDMEIDVKGNNIDENSFDCVPNLNTINGGDCNEEQMGDELNGFLPLDMDLAEFALDMESLLGEESCVNVKELGFLEFKEESDRIEVNIDAALKSVKDEEEEAGLGEAFRWNLDYGSSVLGGKREEEQEEKSRNGGLSSDGSNGEEECMDEKGVKKKKKNAFLRLDYEAVITAWHSQGSPWTTGRRPEFSPGDCSPDCLLGRFMCPIHVINRSEEAATAVGSMPSRQGRGGGGGSDGEREARVLRYREKRRTRLFAKKIRYEVRKLNAEKRPRLKGRFVKRTTFLAAPS